MYYNKFNWVNISYLFMIAIEKYLTGYLFKEDLKKAIYATPDYVYRRRFELLDSNRDFENINASSLQFPFLSYHIDDVWKPVSSKKHFSLAEYGILSSTKTANLRFQFVENDITFLFHFDREDDARLAYDQLLFISNANRWLVEKVSYLHDSLEIPFKIKINSDKIQFNPAIKEEDWLKQNRLFVLSVPMNVETLILKPPIQYTDNSNDDPEPFVITEEVISEFIAGKTSSIQSLSEAVVDNSISLLIFSTERITSTAAKLIWEIEDSNTLTDLKLEINGETHSLNKTDTSFYSRDLSPGTIYIANLYAYRGNDSKHFSLKFSTVASSEDHSDLIGTTW